MVFTFPREEDITAEVIADFIEQHKLFVPKYIENKRYYEGDHDILHREEREEYKPDNKLVVNYAKVIVDTFAGYFIGIPVKLSHKDETAHEAIKNFTRRSDVEDREAELAKMTSIYGHAFEYLYQDEEAHTMAVELSPIDTFVVYDDSIAQHPLFAVRYQYDEEENLQGEMVDASSRYTLGGKDGEVTLSDEEPHYYQGVPIIEYVENAERQSLFENVKSLINGLNEAVSAKADDVEYFADAYLAILGALLDEDTLADLRANRIINMAGDGVNDVVIKFLEKPSADETQENLIDRLIDLIFEVAMVANINDETFGQSASGVALDFKLQPMKNLALMKERKFRKSMQQRFKMMFALPTNVQASLRDEWMNIEYQFSRNIPHNLADEAETAAKLEGVVSKETQLSGLSVVHDVKEEMTRIKEENADEPMYDFQNVGE